MTSPNSNEVSPTFEAGMKLEAVDRRFPYFVCVATIMDRTGTYVHVYSVLVHNYMHVLSFLAFLVFVVINVC